MLACKMSPKCSHVPTGQESGADLGNLKDGVAKVGSKVRQTEYFLQRVLCLEYNIWVLVAYVYGIVSAIVPADIFDGQLNVWDNSSKFGISIIGSFVGLLHQTVIDTRTCTCTCTWQWMSLIQCLTFFRTNTKVIRADSNAGFYHDNSRPFVHMNSVLLL